MVLCGQMSVFDKATCDHCEDRVFWQHVTRDDETVFKMIVRMKEAFEE